MDQLALHHEAQRKQQLLSVRLNRLDMEAHALRE
jgi:hypothetical protein